MLVWAVGAQSCLAQCGPPPPEAANPTVHLDVLVPKLVFRHDVDLLGLSKIHDTFERAPNGAVTEGVTIRHDRVGVQSVRVVSRRLNDGHYCIWATDVVARVGTPETDVFVAANYPEGSCEYTVVVDHESQHVRISREVIQAYAPRLGAALRSLVRRTFPLYSTDATLIQRLPGWMTDQLRPTIDAMVGALRASNGAIDTQENYRRTNALCHNWFPPGSRLPERR